MKLVTGRCEQHSFPFYVLLFLILVFLAKPLHTLFLDDLGAIICSMSADRPPQRDGCLKFETAAHVTGPRPSAAIPP
ncbi:hypothetical protein BO94DRAFT_254699 [Aspergillus sclerotioniger CBS 115572]|uniref:Uncharacterized protein n=1 Tax=Aspergillus sclerotioniger CBS 115572 TaxID=1450535 RepID=A0A317VF31_9EURO|nr:hypothetical protein BO94DRAFT_254699 [Aspergillus sclerotioniger CBS 115572]PWY71811.1 hypothetical protein BO94DRAFT_254699 [Aspergillus sclerotioniger CBS 115572]